MTSYFKYSLSAILFLISSQTYSQKSCKAELLDMYKILTNWEKETGKDKAFYMEYTINTYYTYPGKGELQKHTQLNHIYTASDKSYYFNTDGATYQDEREIAVVFKNQKHIQINRIPPQMKQRGALGTIFRDSLLIVSQEVSCENEVWEGKVVQKIKLVLPKGLQTAYKVENLTFWIDSQAQRIRKMRMEYVSGYQLNYQEIIIHQQKLGIKTEELKFNARNKFLDAQGNPLPAYQGYKVLDYTRTVKK